MSKTFGKALTTVHAFFNISNAYFQLSLSFG